MRILVTGNRGYIGSVLVPMLLEAGHEVEGLDSDLYESCTFTGSVAAIPTRVKDIRDVESGDVADFDGVVHLAGLSNDPLGDYRPNLTDEVNHATSLRLAELAKAAGARRFVFASSCSNYGQAGDDFLNEEASFNPVTPYGESKVKVEEGLARLAGETFSESIPKLVETGATPSSGDGM